MNKSAIALAIAAALAASAVAQAETTLYGSVRVGVQWTDPAGGEEDDQDITDPFTDEGDDNWLIKDESSRIGLKGSEDLGNGISAIYQVEFGFNTAENNSGFSGREQWAGLGGSFGRVRIGTTESPYYTVSGRTDVFLTSFANYSAIINNTRRNNALIYDLPDNLPVSGGLMINMDGDSGEDNDKDAIDEYSVGVNFSLGGFGAGVGYISDEVADEDAFTVAASFDFLGASIGASYEDGDFDDDDESVCFSLDEDGAKYIAVEAQYKFASNIVRAGWNRCDPDEGDEADGFALGIQHNLSSRTLVGLEYQNVEDAANPDDDEDQVALHFRHSF